jgi:hypothetical protein
MSDSLVFVCWFVALGLIVLRYLWGRPTAGLLLCYWAQLALNHLFGHLCYTLSDAADAYIARSRVGFEVTGYAVVGLIAGVLAHDLVTWLQSPTGLRTRAGPPLTPVQLARLNRLGGFTLGFGVFCYALGLTGVYRLLPSSTAVFSASSQLFFAGLCMKWWALREIGRWREAWLWAGTSLLYPFVTTLVGGFIGFGVTGLMILGCFVAPAVRGRWAWITLSPVIVYLGLSVWVTYAATRTELREQIKVGVAFSARFNVLYDGMVNRWTWIDLNDPPQLLNLERLNQNILIGDSVRFLETGQGLPGYGETFEDAVIALVPRILWPDKPAFGGGGNLVSRYTGVQFAEGTAVGIGQVMELYVNFGRPAVLAGFFLMGVLVTHLDGRAMVGLRLGLGAKFLFAFCLGHTALNVIGCFSETLPALIGVGVLVAITLQLFKVGGQLQISREYGPR